MFIYARELSVGLGGCLSPCPFLSGSSPHKGHTPADPAGNKVQAIERSKQELALLAQVYSTQMGAPTKVGHDAFRRLYSSIPELLTVTTEQY